MRLSLLATVVLVPVSATACSARAGRVPPEPMPAAASTPSIAFEAPPPPTQVEVHAPANFPLSPIGPWLVYQTGQGLTVANADGSGRTPLLEGEPLLLDFADFAAPSGGHLASYSFEDPITQTGPTLNLISLPHGTAVFSTPLLSSRIERELREGAESGSAAREAAYAVTLDGALAWSPDGRHLAFVAALDGPSSDLYLLDVSTRRVRRLSSGPNQIAGLSWSPDGEWIAHQAVEAFGDGEWKMGSIWAAGVDGAMVKLYEPESTGEVFVGWSEGGSLVSFSRGPRGPHDLRAAGIGSGVENVVVPDSFNDAAYDPESGTAALAIGANQGKDPGAYVWHPVRGLSLAAPGEWTSVQWSSGAGLYYFEGPEGALAISPDGTVAGSTAEPGRILPAPDGSAVARWDADGGGLHLLTPTLEELREVSRGLLHTVGWRPDSAGMMASGVDGLAYFPVDGPPIVVDPNADEVEELGWVAP